MFRISGSCTGWDCSIHRWDHSILRQMNCFREEQISFQHGIDIFPGKVAVRVLVQKLVGEIQCGEGAGSGTGISSAVAEGGIDKSPFSCLQDMGPAFYGKLKETIGDHNEFKLFVPVLVKKDIRTSRIGKSVQGKGKIGCSMADLFFILLSGKCGLCFHKWFSFRKIYESLMAQPVFPGLQNVNRRHFVCPRIASYLHFYCFERKCQYSVKKVEDN